jgi:hypothetical protein
LSADVLAVTVFCIHIVMAIPIIKG